MALAAAARSGAGASVTDPLPGTKRVPHWAHSTVRYSSWGWSEIDRAQRGHPTGTARAGDGAGLAGTGSGPADGDRRSPSTVLLRGGCVGGLGTCTRCPHFEQDTLRPAACSGALRRLRQVGQAKRIIGASGPGETTPGSAPCSGRSSPVPSSRSTALWRWRRRRKKARTSTRATSREKHTRARAPTARRCEGGSAGSGLRVPGDSRGRPGGT
jgi:hypothetical protein